MHKIFRYLKVSETLKGCPQKFLALWDQKVSTGKTWYPLVCIDFFNTPIFLKHWGDAHEIFRHYETKIFRSKNVIRAFSSIKHCETRNFLKNSKIPLRNFSALWDKIFRRKIVIPHKCITISDTPTFLKNGRDSHEFFRHCETKKFRRGNVIPPSMHRVFQYPNCSETLKGCPQKFSALWDKNLSTENCDTPLVHKTFRYPKFSERMKGCPRNFSALWDQKVSTGKRDTP